MDDHEHKFGRWQKFPYTWHLGGLRGTTLLISAKCMRPGCGTIRYKKKEK